MVTEVHVFGFAIAANVLLSAFPFLIVLASFCRYVLHWESAEGAIYFALRDYFPGEVGDFLVRNLQATVRMRGPIQIGSLFLLLFTANGIFEPLEVALNRVWGVRRDRSFWGNQLVSLGLIFACGALAVASTVLTALNQDVIPRQFGVIGEAAAFFTLLFYKAAAVPLSILMLFLIYWRLPNRRLPARQIVPAAITAGLALEALKYINSLTWPWLFRKLRPEYGPFINSVTILLWSFLAAMVILGVAEWTARNRGGAEKDGGIEPDGPLDR